MAENRVTSITAEVLATPLSQARVSSVAAEILATASSEARISSMSLEALVSVAEVPAVPAPSRAIVRSSAHDAMAGPQPKHPSIAAGLLHTDPQNHSPSATDSMASAFPRTRRQSQAGQGQEH